MERLSALRVVSFMFISKGKQGGFDNLDEVIPSKNC